MSDAPWFETFFDAFYLRQYAPALTDEISDQQVDRIIDLLGLEPGTKVLDLACGHGRHAIRLAERGMDVTGLDLSEVFLARARADAGEAGVDVRWVRADMREIPFEDEFDVVINIFTAFGYFEDDEEDAKVFHAVARALVSGGRLLLETIHRDHLMARYQRRMFEHHEEDEIFVLHDHVLDLVNARIDDTVRVIEKGRVRAPRRTSVRLYTVPEYRRMLEAAGMELERACGGLEGKDLELESFRLAIVSRLSA